MDWLNNLFFGTGIAYCIFVFSIVITVGVILGRIKIAGVNLGITWVLFVGIIASHFGMRIEGASLDFLKEFGLVLFVYSIGLQVGPSFFSSFKKAGLRMNSVAMTVVFAGVALTLLIHYFSGIPMPTMVGIMSGAVTNTPGLGAAQQAYSDIKAAGEPTIALGYAVAYPLGVIGVIASFILLKLVFRINFKGELDGIKKREGLKAGAHRMTLQVENPSLYGRKIEDVLALADQRYFVISRVCRSGGKIEIACADTILEKGDKVLVVCDNKDVQFVNAFIGNRIEMEWQKLDSELEARRIMITNPEINGKTLGKLGLYGGFSFNITRVNRAGIDLVAHANLELQMGDRVTAVGTGSAIKNVEKILGNSMLRLRQPNLIPIFLGIFFGVLVGSIPFAIPGIPQPIKLGLAGGPLIVSILISRFGPKFKLVTYTTVSANLMVREIGIALFLAGVGLGAGQDFVSTVIDGGGYKWIGYGAVITVVPVIVAALLGRLVFKFDYFTLIGILSGSTTNPPALAYSNATANNDMPAVGYATVYPLTMFMRVLSAQLLVIFFV